MVKWRNIKKRLDSLDKKILSSKIGKWGIGIGSGVAAIALVSAIQNGTKTTPIKNFH